MAKVSLCVLPSRANQDGSMNIRVKIITPSMTIPSASGRVCRNALIPAAGIPTASLPAQDPTWPASFPIFLTNLAIMATSVSAGKLTAT